jgi:FAD/FMN-containing dehydrogenase
VAQLKREAHQVIGERLPHDAWRALPAPTSDTISTRIRDAFDPDRIMNSGIFGANER